MQPQELSCGFVLVRHDSDADRFLLVHQVTGSWSFPKGHIEEGETPLECAIRELLEETGITDVTPIPEVSFSEEYEFVRDGVLTKKKNTFFLGTTSVLSGVASPDEVLECRFVTYEEAKNLFAYENGPRILSEAIAVLKS